jgi:hypothetical protein
MFKSQTLTDINHDSLINKQICRYGRDRMVVGFTITCAIRAHITKSCEFEPRSWRGVLDTLLCDKKSLKMPKG